MGRAEESGVGGGQEEGSLDRRRGRRQGGLGSGEDLEADAAVLHVLVEEGSGKESEEAEEVARPGVGPPRVEQDRRLLTPVEGDVHHLEGLEVETDAEAEAEAEHTKRL